MVVDHFHTIRLANTVVDQVRRRTQQATLGHRGRKPDPLYRIRKLLLTAAEQLTQRGRVRLRAGLAVGDPTGEVAVAWQGKELLRAVYAASPLGGQGMNAGIGDAVAVAAALDASLEHGAPDPLAAYSAARRPVAEQVVAVTNRLTWLATMDRQVRTLRNSVLALLNPIASRRLARRLSMLVYR